MGSLLFLVGYVCAAALGAQVLANADPEPLGASVGLALFAVAGFVVSVFAYRASAASSNRSPRVLAYFCTGALCGLFLFAGLAITHFGFGQGISLGVGASALLAVAIFTPLLSAAT
jgi:hypothetical protein